MTALKRKSESKLPHFVRSYLQNEIYHRLEICQGDFEGFMNFEEKLIPSPLLVPLLS